MVLFWENIATFVIATDIPGVEVIVDIFVVGNEFLGGSIHGSAAWSVVAFGNGVPGRVLLGLAIISASITSNTVGNACKGIDVFAIFSILNLNWDNRIAANQI